MEEPVSPDGVVNVLSCEGICLSFAGFQVLKNIDFALQPGKIHAITGENGAGKSSLAKVLAGIYRPESGTIKLGNTALRQSTPKHAQSQGICLIHQEPLPFEELTIAENIYCGNLPTRRGFVDWKKTHDQASKILEQLGVDLNVEHKATGLSIADQQLLELAAALAQNAKYLIFDETTAPLTPNETANLFRVIRELAARGCAIGIVSHHMHEVFEIADEITILRDGAQVAHLNIQQTTPTEVIHLMVGRELETIKAEDNHTAGDILFSAQNLTGPGFSDVSFSINSGEIFGLVGLVGAGRSEVTRSIFGITAIENGELHLNGQRIQPKTPADAIRAGIALVPEDRRISSLFPNRPIRENTSIVSLKKFLGKFKLIDQKREQTAIQALLSSLNTAMRSTEQLVENLSGGNQQKVVLGRWLSTQPKFLILDEPTRGVDIGAKADVHRQIQELSKKGLGVLVVSSDLPEVLALCNRVGVMHKGKLVGMLTRDQMTEEKIMELAAS
jgi:rhamnose transport system ATP-binding protein